MAREWEAQLRAWATAPGTAEQQKIDRADNEIRRAIAASPKLSAHKTDVFPQGSYRNRTNVPRESDVDICVRCGDTFYYDFFPENDLAKKSASITPATYDYPEFKNDVEAALVAHFGRDVVTRGDKAFNVRETRYRVEADVVATFGYRRYTGVEYGGQGTYVQPIGTSFFPDGSSFQIINWPQQQYDNGVTKNNDTRERFKAMTRVLKNLRNEMDDQKFPAAAPIPSFLVECLVYNVPNSVFGNASYYMELKEVLRSLYNNTKTQDTCNDWGEVSVLKYLLRGGQPWSREQANAFVLAAWRYVGYVDA